MKSPSMEREQTPGQVLSRARARGAYVVIRTPHGNLKVTGDPDLSNKEDVFVRKDTFENVDVLTLIGWMKKYDWELVT